MIGLRKTNSRNTNTQLIENEMSFHEPGISTADPPPLRPPPQTRKYLLKPEARRSSSTPPQFLYVAEVYNMAKGLEDVRENE